MCDNTLNLGANRGTLIQSSNKCGFGHSLLKTNKTKKTTNTSHTLESLSSQDSLSRDRERQGSTAGDWGLVIS